VNNSGKTERRRASLSERLYAVIGVIVAARLHEIIQQTRPATPPGHHHCSGHARTAGRHSVRHDIVIVAAASERHQGRQDNEITRRPSHAFNRPSVRPSVGCPARPAGPPGAVRCVPVERRLTASCTRDVRQRIMPLRRQDTRQDARSPVPSHHTHSGDHQNLTNVVFQPSTWDNVRSSLSFAT